MTVKACLVGSGAQNLVTQNANNPVDLDYNICIVDTESIDMNDGREIKEYIRKEFNSVLQANNWSDCQDSASALTTEKRVFKQGDIFQLSRKASKPNIRTLRLIGYNEIKTVFRAGISE